MPFNPPKINVEPFEGILDVGLEINVKSRARAVRISLSLKMRLVVLTGAIVLLVMK